MLPVSPTTIAGLRTKGDGCDHVTGATPLIIISSDEVPSRSLALTMPTATVRNPKDTASQPRETKKKECLPYQQLSRLKSIIKIIKLRGWLSLFIAVSTRCRNHLQRLMNTSALLRNPETQDGNTWPWTSSNGVQTKSRSRSLT